MKKINLAIIALITLLFSSCAFHSGVFLNSTCLSSNNFKVVKLAKGQSGTTKIFGIGGLAKDALVYEAKKDLLANFPLKENQTLANVTVDFKNSMILFVMKTKVTMTADIIEFK
jgi:hypothetical protein